MKKGGQPTGTLPYLPFKRALFACEDILQLGEKALACGAFVAGLGYTEEFEQLALAGRQLGRRLDLDLHDQVAGAAPLQNGHAGPALAELLARLDTRRNLDLMRTAIESGDRQRSTQRRRGEADRRACEQGRALPLEDGVPLHMEEDIARRGWASTARSV